MLVGIVRIASETVGGQRRRGAVGEAHAIGQELDAIVATGQLDGQGEGAIERAAIDDSRCHGVCSSVATTIGEWHHADHIALLVQSATAKADVVVDLVQQIERDIALQRDVWRRGGREGRRRRRWKRRRGRRRRRWW